MNEMAGNSFMIFCSTCSATLRLSLMLRSLGFTANPLNGWMSQNKHLAMSGPSYLPQMLLAEVLIFPTWILW